MPIARVQLPDGRIGKFEVPEGTAPADVEAFVSQQFQPQEPVTQPIQTPATPSWLSSPENAAQQEANRQMLTSVAARTGRIATGIAGSIADLPYTVGKSAYEATRGAQALMGARIAPEFNIPAPSQGLKNVYDVLTNNAGKATGVAGAFDTAAEIGAPLLPAGIAIAPEIGKKLAPKLDEATKVLAGRAQELGIPLRLDQVAPTRFRNTLQKISQEIPFSGVDTFEQGQTAAFNRAVARTIGQDADTLGPETIQAFAKSNSNKFETALAGENINVAGGDITKLRNMKENVTRQLDESLAKVVNNNIDDILGQIGAKDIPSKILDVSGKPITKNVPTQLSGEKLASIRSVLLQNASGASGGAKNALGKVVNIIDDIAAKNLTADKATALQAARREWRNFKTIQPLLKKSVDGNINPTQLMNRIGTQGKYIKSETASIGQDDLVDLARIGKQFLSKKGGSDTFQKSLIGGGVGSLATAAVMNPVLALQGAALTGGGIALNRGVQSINQSQDLLRAALMARGFNPNISAPAATLAAGSIGNIYNRGE